MSGWIHVCAMIQVWSEGTVETDKYRKAVIDYEIPYGISTGDLIEQLKEFPDDFHWVDDYGSPCICHWEEYMQELQ